MGAACLHLLYLLHLLHFFHLLHLLHCASSKDGIINVTPRAMHKSKISCDHIRTFPSPKESAGDAPFGSVESLSESGCPYETPSFPFLPLSAPSFPFLTLPVPSWPYHPNTGTHMSHQPPPQSFPGEYYKGINGMLMNFMHS